jgi:peptidyl-prolyl cis-trans isomerase C
VPPANWKDARPEIVTFLIDNMIIDQYLEALKIAVDETEAGRRFNQVVEEIKKTNNGKYEEVLKKLYLTEADLKTQISASMRWDKFVDSQATEPKLKEMFEKNRNMFDGSTVHARHLLLKMPKDNPSAGANLKARLAALKTQFEEQAKKAADALPVGTDPLTREKARTKALEDAFAEQAKKDSDCPSKLQGGDIGSFPRVGKMVEPFARTAFALKPYEISDVVETEFGFHLILVTGRQAGKQVEYKDAADMVKDVYADRLRDAVLRQMRPRANIVNTPAKQ